MLCVSSGICLEPVVVNPDLRGVCVLTLIHILKPFGLIYCRLCQPLKRTDVTQTAR